MALRVLGAVAASLPSGFRILSVGFPGQVTPAILQRASLCSEVVEALSTATLSRWAAYAPMLLAHPAAACLLAVSPGEIVPFGCRRLGGATLHVAGASIRAVLLGDLLASLADVALLHLAPEPGHLGLLAAALPGLAADPAIIWCDLAGPSDREEAALLARHAESHVAFAVVPCLGVTRFNSPALARATALLLAPRAAWDPFGLDRVADARDPAERAVALDLPALVPRSAALSAGMLARLAGACPRPVLAEPAVRTVLPVLNRVFSVGDPPVLRNPSPVLQLRSRRTSTLAFVPPVPALYDVEILLDSPAQGGLRPERHRSLAIEYGSVTVPLEWNGEEDGLRSKAPLRLTGVAGPEELVLCATGADLELDVSGVALYPVRAAAPAERHPSIAEGHDA